MEKIKLLLYCTKAKPYLFESCITKGKYMLENNEWFKELNGKIVAECDFEVEEIKHTYLSSFHSQYCIRYSTNSLNEEELSRKSCLKQYSRNEDEETLCNYLGENNGYAIHIKNLKERVMELSDCCIIQNESANPMDVEEDIKIVKKAPQNMMRVWIYEDGKWVMYILISVRPEWLYLELIGEKTIELRKKILKEMIK